MRENDLKIAVALERRDAGEAFEEHTAEGVDVRTCVDRAPFDLLRRDVGDRSDERAFAGEARDRGSVPGQAKVAEIRRLTVARADQDVGRFDVPMHKTEAVRGVERVSDLCQQVEGALLTDPPGRLDELAQVVSLDVLHREKEDIALLARRVDGNYVRMFEAGGELRLEQEAPPETFIVGELPRQHLDRGLAPQVEVLAEVDGAHGASAEQALDPAACQDRPKLDFDDQWMPPPCAAGQSHPMLVQREVRAIVFHGARPLPGPSLPAPSATRVNHQTGGRRAAAAGPAPQHGGAAAGRDLRFSRSS